MQKERVLIVDDECEIADLIALYLKNEGFQVFKFYNATDALSCIQTEYLIIVFTYIRYIETEFRKFGRGHIH